MFRLVDSDLLLVAVPHDFFTRVGSTRNSIFFDVRARRILGSTDTRLRKALSKLADKEEVQASRRAFAEFLSAHAEKDAPTPVVDRVASHELAPDQCRAVDAVTERLADSFLITGAAGTGKSMVVKEIARLSDTVITAPTGLAAEAVSGATVHRVFQIPIGLVDPFTLEVLEPRCTRLLRRITRVVIDEISMVRADILDAVDTRLKQARESAEPFGGVHVVMVGDPYQLPPVLRREEEVHFHERLRYKTPFFYSARVFKAVKPTHLQLIVQHRQSDDPAYLALLNRVRTGDHTREDLGALNARVRPKSAIPHLALRLCARKREVDEINTERLEAMPGKRGIFHAVDDWPAKEKPADLTLMVCRGAQVVILRNDPDGRWVNGTRGTVRQWDTREVTVELAEGGVVAVQRSTWEMREPYVDPETEEIRYRTTGTFNQIPLRLCWALTIHKSQGMTLRNVAIDLGEGGGFATGQTYVALSRCRRLRDVTLLAPLQPRDFLVNRSVRVALDWLARANADAGSEDWGGVSQQIR